MTAAPVIVESVNGNHAECFPVAGCTECGVDTPHRVGEDALECMVCEVQA